MTPTEQQSIHDYRHQIAVEILDKLQRNENVSRWDIYSKRKYINSILRFEHNYSDDVVFEVEYAIEAAKESL